ncbi:MAG: hypothetical protein E6I65_00915 [Chloroflexi bacterium]|nr:MAG: hypothetical protein E6I65_00915 [Chloroflexota bacterium]
MTASRDPDARIAAFFESSQPDLPDRTFNVVRRDIHRTRQLVVIGPWREPTSFGNGAFVAATAAVVAVAIVLLNLRPIVGPGGVPSPAPTPTVAPSPAVSSTAAASPTGPTVFTSPMYGYTVTIPAGWLAAPALLRWDGIKQPGPDAEADKFAGPEQLTAWAFAGPFSGDLAAFVTDRITANARDHSDTCPRATPEINEPLPIGGQAWVLLGWNCGALINNAVTVRAGVAYEFAYRDLGIEAATDPADRALFQSILNSVELPN